MDVTPQVINEVEFHQKKIGGYDPDEVDDFLERVAVAVGEMQARVRELSDRAQAAERRNIELEGRLKQVIAKAEAAPTPAAAAPMTGGDIESGTETITRTLVLAQRTADAAVAEAREEAQRIVADAEAAARKLIVEAEVNARRASEEARTRLVSEIVALEETRDGLRADQSILERHLDEQRLRLRSAIADLQRLVDDPSRLRQSPPPTLPSRGRPAFIEEELQAASSTGADETATTPEVDKPPSEVDTRVAAEAGTDAEVNVKVEPAASGATAGEDEWAAGPAEEEFIDLAEDESVAVDPRPSGGVVFTVPDEVEEAPAVRLFDDATAPDPAPEEEEAWSRFVGAATEGPALSFDATGDDAYLTELRRAMATGGGSGGRNPLRLDDAEQARPRFGRRR